MSSKRAVTITISDDDIDWLQWEVFASYCEDRVSSDTAEKKKVDRFYLRLLKAWNDAGEQ